MIDPDSARLAADSVIRGVRLHVVTDDAVLARAEWADTACAVLEAGAAAVALHVRGPRATGRNLHDRATAVAATARAAGSVLIVNDRIDVALTVGADGVHLGGRSLDMASARALLPTGRTVGVSVHGDEELRSAVAEGADYAFVGTIHPTPSHPGVPGIGMNGLRDAARRADGLPIVAIGGIDTARAGEAMRAGASAVAVVRGVWDAADPADAVLAYLGAMEGARE